MLLGEEGDVFAAEDDGDDIVVAVSVVVAAAAAAAAAVEALVMEAVWALAPELQNQYRQQVVVLAYH